MANEAKLSNRLLISKNNLNYQSQTTNFTEDVSGSKGPSPGAITVSTEGTDVDLSELTTPGLCELRNLDQTNYVEYGIRDPSTGIFYPLGEIPPGKGYVLRLSRNLQESYTNTGTGTSADTTKFHIKANRADCIVLVAAFES